MSDHSQDRQRQADDQADEHTQQHDLSQRESR
jgi:hypothetical protein